MWLFHCILHISSVILTCICAYIVVVIVIVWRTVGLALLPHSGGQQGGPADTVGRGAHYSPGHLRGLRPVRRGTHPHPALVRERTVR